MREFLFYARFDVNNKRKPKRVDKIYGKRKNQV